MYFFKFYYLVILCALCTFMYVILVLQLNLFYYYFSKAPMKIFVTIFVTIQIFFSKLPFYACFGNIIIIIPFSGTVRTHLGLNEPQQNKCFKLPVKPILHKCFPSNPDICFCMLFACRCDESWVHRKLWWPCSQTRWNCRASSLYLHLSFLSIFVTLGAGADSSWQPAVLCDTGTSACISYKQVMKWKEQRAVRVNIPS